MYYVIAFFVGVIAGAACFSLYVIEKLRESSQARKIADGRTVAAKLATEDAQKQQDTCARWEAGLRAEFSKRESELAAREADSAGRIITYKNLQDENLLLRQDLRNTAIHMNKLQLDGVSRQNAQDEIDKRSQELGRRYLDGTVKWIGETLTADNFTVCKQRLTGVIEKCRQIRFEISEAEEAQLVADLKAEFQKAVRAQIEREEQARMKARIREEERLKREVERELQQLERERAAIRAALDKALAEAQGKHSEEIQRLEARLAEADEKSRRALSMAQQTRAGHVYVLSNLGSFGDGVFKIGMTRRLEPKERVSELCSAAVPFPFDIHMMIRCDDAPKLENVLHRELRRLRLNRVNPRKEFFRTSVESIKEIVQTHHGEVQYVADAEALQYRQSIQMPDEDAQFIESTFQDAEDEVEGADIL